MIKNSNNKSICEAFNKGTFKKNERNWLKPLNSPDSKNKELTIVAADFETIVYDGVHVVIAGGIKMGVYYKCFGLTDLNELKINENLATLKAGSKKLILNLISELFIWSAHMPNCYVYFHNMGRFDGIFLIDALIDTNYKITTVNRNGIFYEIKIINDKKRCVVIRDSYNIIPMSLQDAALSINEKKLDWDHSRNDIGLVYNDVFIKEFLKYLENDVFILYKILIKYFKIYDIIMGDCHNPYFTVPGLALNIFRKFFYKKINICKLHHQADIRIRSSFYGGVVDVYKPTNDKKRLVYAYDVNSLYPYIMANFEMPVGPPIMTEGPKINLNNFFGFVHAKIKSPSDLKLPILPFLDQNKLIQPLGSWENMYFSEELKLAIENGYIIEPVYGYSFQRAVIFNDYVNHFYNKRLQATETVDKKIYKLLLNSLFGRLGMTQAARKSEIIQGTDLSKISKFYTINNITALTNDRYFVTYTENLNISKLNYHLAHDIITLDEYNKHKNKLAIKFKAVNTSVHISSAITAYARIFMYKYKKLYQNELLYSDTDSLYLTSEMAAEYVSADKLGYFKLEGIYDRAFFIAPKIYSLFNKDKPPIIKIKGLSEITAKENKELFKQKFWKDCLKKDMVPLKTLFKHNFIRNIPKFEINADTHEREMVFTLAFSKRTKVFNSKNIWVDTKPLFLKDFTIKV